MNTAPDTRAVTLADSRVTVYDNGGETFDRYTVIFEDGDALGIGDTGNVPNGFCQHLPADTIMVGDHLGEIIPLGEMTPAAIRAVLAELAGWYDGEAQA